MNRVGPFVGTFFLAIALLISSANVYRQSQAIKAKDEIIKELFIINEKNQATLKVAIGTNAQYETMMRSCLDELAVRR